MTKLKPKCTTCRISGMCLLKNCTRETLEEISGQKTCVSFRKGDYLFKEGEKARGFYCLRSGICKSEIQRNQRNLIIGLHRMGTVFGQRIVSEKDKNPITVRIVEQAEACYIGADKFLKLIEKHPSLKTEIMRSLAAELRHVEDQALYLVYRSVKERVASALLQIASIYGYRQSGSSIHIQLDRQDIADLTGTTKEQVSHILADLSDEGLIHFKAKVFKFFDLEGLKFLAAGEQQ